MKRFVEFTIAEYMDEHPHQEVRVFTGTSVQGIEKSARKFAEEMTLAYSGGPTNFVKVMTAEEAKELLTEKIAKITKPDAADKLWIEEATNLFNECYSEK